MFYMSDNFIHHCPDTVKAVPIGLELLPQLGSGLTVDARSTLSQTPEKRTFSCGRHRSYASSGSTKTQFVRLGSTQT